MDSGQSGLLIVGSGAMACLFAARLAAASMPVVMLGSWPEGVQALRQNGLRLLEPDGSRKTFPVQVIEDGDGFEAKYALVLVKSWQTERVAGQLAGCLSLEGLALTLQNGLGNAEALAKSLSADRVALGVTTLGANLAGPGQVRPAGTGAITLSDHPRLAPLADMLRKAGFAVEITPDARGLLWGKLVINAAINPLTAILGAPNGALLERPTAHAVMAAAALEAAAVALANGISLPYADPVGTAEEVAQRTAANLSSMLQDVRRGAPTEIDVINGAIVKIGAQTGVPTPVNQTLWRLVKALILTNEGTG